MNIQFFEIISIIGITQGIFLSSLLLLKKNNKAANYFLSVLITLVSLILLYNLFIRTGILKEYYSLSAFVNTVVFLFPTLHILYAIFLLDPVQKFTTRSLLHFIPFIFINIICIPVYLQNEAAISLFDYIRSLNINNLVSSIYSITIMLLVLRLLEQHTQKIKMNFSSIEKINLNWLKVITSIIIVFDILFILLLYLPTLLNFNPTIPNIILIVLMVLLIFITAIFGFKQPEIFHVFPSQSKSVKYKTSGLSEKKALEIEQTIVDFLKSKKPYLNENLNIDELSDNLNVTPAYLSQVLNERLGVNFYTLINTYRIEEAKKLIISSEYSHFKLEAIAYEVGFKSKSTFNAAFKKITGTTPSQFRVEAK
jgi:AraC-like DNA-binding protein